MKNNNRISTGSNEVLEQVQTVNAGDSIVFAGVPTNKFLSAWASFPIVNEIAAVGTIDPTNVSTGDANLIDNNLTNLTYNNSSATSANKELPAIDLGSSLPVGLVKVHWWNNTYTASDYKIQGSNDGTTWTDLATGLNSSGIVGTTNNPQEVSVSGSWQYLRVFCVTGDNATWVVISELEAFDPPTNFVTQLIVGNSNFVIKESATGEVEIENIGATDVDITVYFI